METQQSTNETNGDQGKTWYKHGLGLVIAILFFPYFLLWYMWAKTNWGKTLKTTITVAFVFLNIVAVASDDPNKNISSQQATQSTDPQPAIPETKNESSAPQAPQLPQAVFDVPSLIGKNIDEVKKTLGTPTTYLEPTKQQLAIMSIWDMGYTKDGVDLDITYNLKTKTVLDYSLSYSTDGSDKSKLLALGNLQEKSDSYVTEFVKNASKQDEILGIKITKKLPSDLDGAVAYNAVAFQISNNEDYDWTDCRLEINGGVISSGYEYKTSSGIKAKDKLIVPFSEFTKNGERFNFITQKPEKLFIACNTIGQHRTNYFAIK